MSAPPTEVCHSILSNKIIPNPLEKNSSLSKVNVHYPCFLHPSARLYWRMWIMSVVQAVSHRDMSGRDSRMWPKCMLAFLSGGFCTYHEYASARSLMWLINSIKRLWKCDCFFLCKLVKRNVHYFTRIADKTAPLLYCNLCTKTFNSQPVTLFALSDTTHRCPCSASHSALTLCYK